MAEGIRVPALRALAVETAALRSRRTAIRLPPRRLDPGSATRLKAGEDRALKHEVYGAKSSTMTAGDWLQLCNEHGDNI